MRSYNKFLTKPLDSTLHGLTRGCNQQISMQTQTNNNSGENTSRVFVSPTASIEIDSCSFLGELLEDSQGTIKVKNLLNNVFLYFFQSDIYCQHNEPQRADYAQLLGDLQDWVDLCHSEFVANQAEDEAAKTLATLEEMREKLVNKKNARK